MANLPESSQWEEGIFQLETTTPVKGGTPVYNQGGEPVDGFSNVQAQKLANRTRFLKEKLEEGGTPSVEVVSSLGADGFFILGSATPNTFYVVGPSDFFTYEFGSEDHPVGSEIHILNRCPFDTTSYSYNIDILVADGYSPEFRASGSVSTLKKLGVGLWAMFGDLAELPPQ